MGYLGTTMVTVCYWSCFAFIDSQNQVYAQKSCSNKKNYINKGGGENATFLRRIFIDNDIFF